MFPLKYIDKEYYFRNNMVCDEAVENIITTSQFGAVANMSRYTQINNMFLINKYYKKREVQKLYWEKWYCEDYAERLDRTKSLQYWNDFPGFYDPHLPSAMKKSVLKHLWEIEFGKLDKASKNHFRAYDDLTQYLVRYWQICSGQFYPRKTKGKVFFVDINNYKNVASQIKNREHEMICINENCTIEEFDFIKNEINAALEEILFEKSSFEL